MAVCQTLRDQLVSVEEQEEELEEQEELEELEHCVLLCLDSTAASRLIGSHTQRFPKPHILLQRL